MKTQNDEVVPIIITLGYSEIKKVNICAFAKMKLGNIDVIHDIKFYIIDNITATAILRNEFLYANISIVNYKTGVLEVNKNHFNFSGKCNNAEIIDDVLEEKINMFDEAVTETKSKHFPGHIRPNKGFKHTNMMFV